MRTRDKITIAVLGILIFVAIGANTCTYFTISAFDPILVVVLGVLVFVEAGAIMCSYYNGKNARLTSN